MFTPRITSFIAVIVFCLLVWAYVKEYAVFSNTLEIKALVLGSMLVAALTAGSLLWRWRARFKPFGRHVPELALILVFSVLFAPLFGSLLNRSIGSDGTQSFEFVAETAYFASGYGLLKGESLKPTGWRLTVRDHGRAYRFKYKSQAYFPLTKPGEKILLPLRRGIFGVRVVQLR